MTSERRSADDDLYQILRRRNDLMQQYLEMDAKITTTEIRVIDQLNRDAQNTKLKEQEHEQAKDLARHKAELEKEVRGFKERYLRGAGLEAENDNERSM